MHMFLSLLHIPGFSFAGYSPYLSEATPQSITNSGQLSTGLFALSKPTQNTCSFGATPLPVYGMQQSLQPARLCSAARTGEPCSGDVIQ